MDNEWIKMTNSYLEYYLTNCIHRMSNHFHDTKIGIYVRNLVYTKFNNKKKNTANLNEIICKDYKFLTQYNYYDKSIDIDEINQYTVININIDASDSLKNMAKNCLTNILKSKKILINNKPVRFKDCVIVDIINTSVFTISTLHTDIEYSDFIGNSFNVWYLIENNKSYGNMFLLESDEYKKEYTPCRTITRYNGTEISNYEKYKTIDLYKHSFYSVFIGKEGKKVATLKKFKVIYTDIKNGDCLVMSKHVIHSGDKRRNNNVKGFHFRVLVKNKDGSIDYNKFYKSLKFPNHRYDEKNKKIFGVELFDFA